MKSVVVFIVSILTAIIVLLVGWHRDPSYSTFPKPGMTIYFAIFGFVMTSLLIFGANVILAISKGRKAKSEDELEAIVAPALQSREYDERIMKWTVFPRAIVSGLAIGALCAVVIHHCVS
jgi:hypothetical protein